MPILLPKGLFSLSFDPMEWEGERIRRFLRLGEESRGLLKGCSEERMVSSKAMVGWAVATFSFLPRIWNS